MARSLVQVRAIAVTAFQETLRRKVFYLVAILAIFIIAMVSSGRVLLQMATEAGDGAFPNPYRHFIPLARPWHNP